MKVYYNCSLWCKGKGLWGWSQRTNWQFEYAGSKRYIPAIYRFSRGIVFDIITVLDEGNLKKFFEKYEIAQEEKLTPLQKRLIEQEHPYQPVQLSKIWINGKRVDGYSSSSGISIPWLTQGADLAPLRKAYSSILKDDTCFACQRYCVPYPETDSKYQKLLRFLHMEKINEIKLSTYPVQRFYPLDIHFKMSVGEKEKEISLVHPMTETKHKLYFQNAKRIKIPLGEGPKEELYIMQPMYEIEPALPPGHTLQFDSSIWYLKEPELPLDKFSPTSAATIGIIGGADGPTSIFIASKGRGQSGPCGLHGLPLYSCYSMPSFTDEDTFHFHLEGINTLHNDSQEFALTVL